MDAEVVQMHIHSLPTRKQESEIHTEWPMPMPTSMSMPESTVEHRPDNSPIPQFTKKMHKPETTDHRPQTINNRLSNTDTPTGKKLIHEHIIKPNAERERAFTHASLHKAGTLHCTALTSSTVTNPSPSRSASSNASSSPRPESPLASALLIWS